jgi:hypothetical protein
MGFFDFAPTEPNRLRPLQLGLCVLDVPDLPEDKPEVAEEEPPKPKPDAKDPYLEKMKVEVVEEAYVLLFPAPASAKTMILCRTNKRGQLVRIERGEVGSPVPEDKKRLVFVNEGATYLCFWSFHKGLFERALADVDKDLAKARRRNPFFEFEARAWKRERVFDAEFDDRHPTAQHDHDKLSFLFHNLGPRGRGFFAHSALAEANRDPTSPYFSVSAELFKGKLETACWVFARRPALAVTYLAEFSTRYAARLRAASAWHYAQMHTALSLVDAAEKGRRVEELDKELHAALVANRHSYAMSDEAHAYHEQYWRYAWECATKEKGGQRVERKLFERAVTILFNQDDWKKAAFEIAESFGVLHPAFTDRRGVEVTGDVHFKLLEHKKAVLQYFDLYRFGAEQGEKPWARQVAVAEKSVESALQTVATKLRQAFAAHGGYRALLEDLGAHVKDDKARESLQRRYLDAAEDSGHSFWDDLPEKAGAGGPKEDESGELEVERPDPLLDIKPYVDVAFISTAKQAEVFEQFFEHRGHALAHRITEARKGFDELFSKMVNLDEKILKSKLATIKTEDIRLEADFATKKIVVAHEGKAIGDFEFVVEDTGLEKARQVRVKSRSGKFRTQTKRVPVQRAKAGKFEPLKEFEEAEHGQMKLPQWFAAFGYAVLIAYDLYTLKEQLKEKSKIEVFGRLGVNCGLGMASLSEAVELTFHGQIKNKFIKGAGEAFGKLGKVAGKAAVVVEIVLTAREGAILLFDHEESEVTDALEEGNMKVAYAQEAKGIVLLGGAAGAGAVALFASSIATGGLVLVGVAVTVALIDLYSWLESDGSTMKGASKKLGKALAGELGSDYAPFRTEERFDTCRTHEKLERLAQDLERVERLVDASHA